MNVKVKWLWIKALRSGKFKQGQGQLCIKQGTARRHCCLGVLEELAISAGIITKYDIWQGHLDSSVKRWAGLGNADPKLGPRVDSRTASYYNDNGKTFTQIADRIEKYP